MGVVVFFGVVIGEFWWDDIQLDLFEVLFVLVLDFDFE